MLTWFINTKKIASPRRRSIPSNRFKEAELLVDCVEGKADEDNRQPTKSKQAWNLDTGDPRYVARKVFHLVSEFLVNAPGSLVHCRAHQILQHLLILAGENVRLDVHVNHLLLAVHLHSEHA